MAFSMFLGEEELKFKSHPLTSACLLSFSLFLREEELESVWNRDPYYRFWTRIQILYTMALDLWIEHILSRTRPFCNARVSHTCARTQHTKIKEKKEEKGAP